MYPRLIMIDVIFPYLFVISTLLEMVLLSYLMVGVFERFFHNFKKSKTLLSIYFIILIAYLLGTLSILFIRPFYLSALPIKILFFLDKTLIVVFVVYLLRNFNKSSSINISRYFSIGLFNFILFLTSNITPLIPGLTAETLSIIGMTQIISLNLFGLIMLIVIDKEMGKVVITK